MINTDYNTRATGISEESIIQIESHRYWYLKYGIAILKSDGPNYGELQKTQCTQYK